MGLPNGKAAGDAMLDEALKELKFDDKGLIPAITLDAETGEVLMMAWMNAESLKATVETGKTHYWSRSRQKFWMKGESSGHTQTVESISTDCDKDVLLIRVRQIGGACHTGYRSCFSWHLTDGRWIERGKRIFDPDKVYDT
jgi:phosphoribosyl-AMP cyclohydrolase